MLKYFILFYLFVCGIGHKIVSFKPGGLKGFYMLGISKYLKENYHTNDYIFYGSSAGSWNVLYLTLPIDNSIFFDGIYLLSNNKYSSLYSLENDIKTFLIDKFENIPIENNKKANICLTKLNIFRKKKIIISNFDNIQDFVDCCIASSHLPFITNGKFFCKFNNSKYIDGGIFRNNYPNHIKPDLIISYKMFNNKNIYKCSKLYNLNIEKLIYEGYKDAKNNYEIFDNLLL